MGHQGKRTVMMFFDMKESADFARMAAVLFLGADAEVEFVPVMNGDESEQALGSLSL